MAKTPLLIMSMGDFFPYHFQATWSALPFGFNWIEAAYHRTELMRLSEQLNTNQIDIDVFGTQVHQLFTFAPAYDSQAFKAAWNAGVTLNPERVKSMLEVIQRSGVECHIVSDTNVSHWVHIQQFCKENNIVLPENMTLSCLENKPYTENLARVIEQSNHSGKQPVLLRFEAQRPSFWQSVSTMSASLLNTLQAQRRRNMDAQQSTQRVIWDRTPDSLAVALLSLMTPPTDTVISVEADQHEGQTYTPQSQMRNAAQEPVPAGQRTNAPDSADPRSTTLPKCT